MFGMNEIVGQKFFKEAPGNTLLVTSRFFTLQGEGPFRGIPAYFIRLAKCNLACSFCDTYFDSGTQQTFEEILTDATNEINRFFTSRDMEVPDWAKPSPDRKIVLVMTGGEPTLQKNLYAFLEEANKQFRWTQIESNGTLGCELPEKTTMVVSPKCLEKNNVAVRYLTPKPAMLERADCLKFVLCAPELEQFSPYSSVPEWAHEWAWRTGKEVYVSPMNIYKKEPQKAKELRAQKDDITLEERSYVDEVISFWEPDLLDFEKNQRNHEYTAEYAMKHGFILNLQIHLFASLP